ncbi:MAG: alkaline phosphatase family protein [Verrucomicrobiae bacterium]|nr:alkaline phosphatase family protein [Verrucomicrobiae bacterium]
MLSATVWAGHALFGVVPDESTPLTRIALGSCARQNLPQPIWEPILASEPDLFVFLGDNIYGDSEDMEVLRRKYAQLDAKPGFQKLRQSIPILATWDDHDYGKDDAGFEYPMKVESQKLFLEFFEEPEDSPRWNRPGIYDAKIFGPKGKRVQIILLDTRYFRGPLRPKPPVPGRGTRYLPSEDTSSTMLGETQWKWLEEQLHKPAEIRIIASSIQVISEEHDSEKWMNLPHERERLYKLLYDSNAAGVILVSGDVHRGELSMIDAGLGYPLFDLTCSGLTQVAKVKSSDWPNRYRVGTVDWTTSFGVIEFDWEALDPLIRLQIRDGNGEVCLQRKVALSELQPK